MIYKLSVNYNIYTDISNLYGNIAMMAHYSVWLHTLVIKEACHKINFEGSIV